MMGQVLGTFKRGGFTVNVVRRLDKYREATEWTRNVGKRWIGYMAHDGQQAAKSMAPVLTGRLKGSISVQTPDSGFFVHQKAEPQEYGVTREEAVKRVQEIDKNTFAVAFGAYVPYARVAEVLRGHRFLLPGFDEARRRRAKTLQEAKDKEGKW